MIHKLNLLMYIIVYDNEYVLVLRMYTRIYIKSECVYKHLHVHVM